VPPPFGHLELRPGELLIDRPWHTEAPELRTATGPPTPATPRMAPIMELRIAGPTTRATLPLRHITRMRRLGPTTQAMRPLRRTLRSVREGRARSIRAGSIGVGHTSNFTAHHTPTGRRWG